MTPGKEIFYQGGSDIDTRYQCRYDLSGIRGDRLDRVRTECSVSYLDHNLLYVDNKTPDDHIYLQSAAKKFGVYVSRPGNGICHTVHVSRFGVPGQGIDGRRQSHTAWRRDRYAVYRCRRHGCSNGDDGCSDASDDARVVRVNLTGN